MIKKPKNLYLTGSQLHQKIIFYKLSQFNTINKLIQWSELQGKYKDVSNLINKYKDICARGIHSILINISLPWNEDKKAVKLWYLVFEKSA